MWCCCSLVVFVVVSCPVPNIWLGVVLLFLHVVCGCVSFAQYLMHGFVSSIGCPSVSDEVIGSVLGCATLRALRVRKCTLVSDLSLYTMSRAACAHHLVHLTLSHLPLITNTGVANLAVSVPTLAEVSLHDCEQVRLLVYLLLVSMLFLHKRAFVDR